MSLNDRTPDCPPLPRYIDLTDACRPTDDHHGNWWSRNGWAGVREVIVHIILGRPYTKEHLT